jgi:uncharacterized repeat protein (TIGR03803 family)
LYELFLADITGPATAGHADRADDLHGLLSDRFDFDPISNQGRPCSDKTPPLWRFSNSTGAFPNGQLASLPSVRHVLYGTSVYGGTHGSGAIYSYDTDAHTQQLLYSFPCQPAREGFGYPYGGLMYYGGAFYGTTYVPSAVFKFVP